MRSEWNIEMVPRCTSSFLLETTMMMETRFQPCRGNPLSPQALSRRWSCLFQLLSSFAWSKNKSISLRWLYLDSADRGGMLQESHHNAEIELFGLHVQEIEWKEESRQSLANDLIVSRKHFLFSSARVSYDWAFPINSPQLIEINVKTSHWFRRFGRSSTSM